MKIRFHRLSTAIHRLLTALVVIPAPLSPAEMLKRGEGLGGEGSVRCLYFFEICTMATTTKASLSGRI